MTCSVLRQMKISPCSFYSELMNMFHSPESATNKNSVGYVTCVTSLIKFVCVHILMFIHEVESEKC